MRWLTLATIIAAAGSFGILFLSANTLSITVNEQFTAYWGLFFAFTGVLGGLMQETTRTVGSAGRKAPQSLDDGSSPSGADTVRQEPTGPMARPFLIAGGVGLVTFAFFAVTGPFWMRFIVQDEIGWAVILMAAGLGLYAVQAAVSGLLSGAGLWKQYAMLIMLDVVCRLVLAGVAFSLGWGLLSFLVITALGTVSWIVIVALSPASRRALTQKADVPTRRFITLMITAMGASGASALLVTGFPTLVVLASRYGVGSTEADAAQAAATGAVAVTAAGISYAVLLTRAPLLMPLEKFQNAIIVYFVKDDGHPLVTLAKPLGALSAFGVAGSVAAWLIGPWILQILPGGYMIPGVGLFALTLGATVTAVLMVTGSVTLATNHHRTYLVGWVLATITATVILFLPGALLWRTAAALIIGPGLGIVLHLWRLSVSARNTLDGPSTRTLSP